MDAADNIKEVKVPQLQHWRFEVVPSEIWIQMGNFCAVGKVITVPMSLSICSKHVMTLGVCYFLRETISQ